MRIGLDARWIFEEMSGIGVYTRELIRALAQRDHNNEYMLFFDNESVRDRTVAETGIAAAPNFSTALCPYSLFSISNQLRMPALLRRAGLDVYHAPNYLIPLPAFPRRRRRATVRCVVTIHDVIPMIFPHHAPRSRKSRVYPLYRRLMIEIARRADQIISDSETSRRDVISYLRIMGPAQAKVHAVYCGVAPHFRPVASAPLRNGDPRHEPATVLYVGRADPYKNLVALVQAFAQARKRCPFPMQLALVGARDARYPEAERRAQELGIAADLKWIGRLSDQELAETYRQARVLVMPSRYEGFGLPVLEAMASGTPVICGDIGTLREIAGDAATFVDPDDVDGLAQQLVRILTEPASAAGLVSNGLTRAARFTWDETARQTLAVYEQAAL